MASARNFRPNRSVALGAPHAFPGQFHRFGHRRGVNLDKAEFVEQRRELQALEQVLGEYGGSMTRRSLLAATACLRSSAVPPAA
jgi:hypothetical protein